MNIWWTGLGVLTAVVSAVALYAASRHCRWRMPPGWPRILRPAGVLLAVASLASCIHAFGIAVGTCTMLAAWMLAMVLLPWLAVLVQGAVVDATRAP